MSAPRPAAKRRSILDSSSALSILDLLSDLVIGVLTPEDGWSARFVLRVGLSTVMLYCYIVVLARLFGSRTFASFTSYDFLTNIAAGSLVASAIMGPNVVEGGLGLLVLVLLQAIVSGASARWRPASRAFDNAPVVLVARGRLQRQAIRQSRVSEAIIAQHLRQAGVTDLSRVRFAVLESGGNLSIVQGDPEDWLDDMDSGFADPHVPPNPSVGR
ncbi:DUF421 domain-containing protein [uncultured Paracoccus sp.]|uniref:DUF421 domain-containing protein n=1 Tax=uncultured Paracoccus sp. TaxID=189685 RepID=UPI0026330E93|nr:YetF domain-containing protein [uncultured Paracoccus sp.]